jgi:hypothetical protein
VIALLLPSPNTIALPGADRRDAPPSETRGLVAERWPEIERLVADDGLTEAIAALERLAVEMRRATERDAPLFGEALTLARSVLYDDVVEIGRAAGCEALAQEALARCAEWDEELRSDLEELAS